MKFEIKVLSANLWLSIPLIMRDARNRVKKFSELVNESEPDFILIQEVWLNRNVRLLKKYLKGYYPLTTRTLVKKRRVKSIFNPFNRPGLVIFSRTKPVGYSYHRYQSLKRKDGFIEKVAQKGFLEAIFEINDQKVSLLNTHLYDWRDFVRKVITIDQLKTMLNYQTDSDISIFCGDFNLSTEEVVNIAGGTFIHDGAIDHTSVPDNIYRQGKIYKFLNRSLFALKENRKVDHILVKVEPGISLKIITKTIKKPLVSDHFPLLATVTVDK